MPDKHKSIRFVLQSRVTGAKSKALYMAAAGRSVLSCREVIERQIAACDMMRDNVVIDSVAGTNESLTQCALYLHQRVFLWLGGCWDHVDAESRQQIVKEQTELGLRRVEQAMQPMPAG